MAEETNRQICDRCGDAIAIDMDHLDKDNIHEDYECAICGSTVCKWCITRLGDAEVCVGCNFAFYLGHKINRGLLMNSVTVVETTGKNPKRVEE